MTVFSDTIISTTTSLSRVRGFTVILLFHLKGHELRTMDLIEATGKYHGYVSRYLFNMLKYGLVEKNGSIWKLTQNGVDFLFYLESLPNNNIIIRKIAERKLKDGRKIDESCGSKKTKQISIQIWLQNSSLDEIEKEVVEVLMDHYNRTGSKFLLVQDFYELTERLNKPPHSIDKALKNLRQDNIIYIFRLREQNCWKIGIKKHFIELLNTSE